MKTAAKKHILNIEPYQPGKPIEEVRRELGLKDVVKLASNENPYNPPAKIIRAIEKAAKTINRYPDGGCFYLRRELAKRLKVSCDQLIFGNGSDEIIVLLLRAFVSEGDEVVVAQPSFLVYDIASRMEGAVVKPVPLRDFHYDLDRMAEAVTRKTKVIFIGNPDNPAGTYVTAGQLKSFLKNLPRDILVLIDEAYYEYVSAKDYPDAIRLLKAYKNIIITRTFSKMYGLAGLRIGYGIAHRETVDILNRVREPFNVNSLAQAAAVACLKERNYYSRAAKQIEEQRLYLYQQLSKMDVAFVRTATNFILIDVKEKTSGKRKSTKISRELLKKGVIVRDMIFWGLDTFIRVTIGKKEENRKFIKALKELLS